MAEKIPEILKKLENDHNIEILYSVEAGSRAWGFDSPDSDYDIRFIYRQKDYRKYLSLNEPAETIDGFSEDRLYDWQGWDIKKALKLLRQSNPSLLEWLYTPIVYFKGNNNLVQKSIELVETSKQVKPLYFHYKSMAKSNYLKHINDNQQVSCKKYLYVIRPAAMVFWLLNVKNRRFLEIKFDVVLEDMKPLISDVLYQNIVTLIRNKKLMLEVDKCERIKCVDDWLNEIIFDKTEPKFEDENHQKIKMEDCDQLFLHILGIN